MQNDTERQSTARKRSAPFVTKNACLTCRKERARASRRQLPHSNVNAYVAAQDQEGCSHSSDRNAVTPLRAVESRLADERQCDGNHPCARCLAHDEPRCHYVVSTRVTKDAMRYEIEIIKAYKDASERALEALTVVESPESDTNISRVMDALRNGKEAEEISRFLEDDKVLPTSRE